MIKRALIIVAALALEACSSEGIAPGQPSPSLPLPSMRSESKLPKPPAELGSLNYSNGSISVYHIANNVASIYARFRPENGTAQGLAIDANGLVYTAITKGKRCGTCVEVFTPQGRFENALVAPKLSGAPGHAALNNVSVDETGGVYVSDYGQEAVYYYPAGATSSTVPTVIVRNLKYAGPVNAVPDGTRVVIGGCSFGSASIYRREPSGKWVAGACFSFPTISLLGTASDNLGVTVTPTDPNAGTLVVSEPNKQKYFSTPNATTASVMSVAMNASGNLLYAADQHNDLVYVFSRPTSWFGGQPPVIATYKGFRHLDVIAVPQR
jgi:hypothetical protein